jgi:chemosensory pili system protein ChpB (putative protein-glutamate methylesterase)
MNNLHIGIVSETLVQQHFLKHAVEDIGCKSLHAILVTDLILSLGENQHEETNRRVDAWIIVVDIERLEQHIQEPIFQQWLSSLEQPVIFSEGNSHNAADTDFISWTRQLTVKLLNLEGQIQLSKQEKIKAQYVWVLAASTGGPEAVKRFIGAMEANLGVGFIYVQHIDQTQCRALSEAIARDSDYQSAVVAHGDIVCSNTVMVVPPNHAIELQSNGAMIVHKNRQWRGVYKPSIDQIVANVASIYGVCSGVIFFTGMGNDGSTGCRLMALQGGQVWAQAISTCVSPSMPQEAINTGYVNKIDTPESLAIHLKTLINTAKLKKNHG